MATHNNLPTAAPAPATVSATARPSPLSPALLSTPVFPDDAGCFDRTTTSSPVCPTETLQQCGVSRIIQIQPTLLKNPGARGLIPRPLIRLLEQAAPLGYNVVHLCGSEPFEYPHLGQLAKAAHSLGYCNSVITDGMLLPSPHARRILHELDLVTISIDGKPEKHDIQRRQQGAFTRMTNGLEIVKDTVEKFGLIHTLLPDSWKVLSWLTDFALGHKASLLHLHSPDLSGSATRQQPGRSTKQQRFSPTDCYRVFIAHYYLKTFSEPDLYIQLDLLHRDSIIGNPRFFFHQNTHPEFSARGFSYLFKELFINEAGDILPIAQGCSPFFRIGNIFSGQSLEEMIRTFMEKRLGDILQLYNDTYRDILADAEYELFNWSEKVIENSYNFSTNIGV
jgi:hypothetical protein